jgi:hypothetical protein
MRGPVGMESDLKGARAALGEGMDGGGVGLSIELSSCFTTGPFSRGGSAVLGEISGSLLTMSSSTLITVGERERGGSL